MSYIKNEMMKIEEILTSIKGWNGGEVNDSITTLKDAYENCEHIYCTEEELVELNYKSSNPANIHSTYSNIYVPYIWEYDSTTHSYTAKVELTNMIKNLMFECLLKGAK